MKKDITKWHRYFVLLPKKTINDELVYFETVLRKEIGLEAWKFAVKDHYYMFPPPMFKHFVYKKIRTRKLEELKREMFE